MKRFFVIILTALFFITLPGLSGSTDIDEVHAASASELEELYKQLRDLEQRQKSLNKNLSNTKNTKKKESEKLEDLNSEIDVLEGQINTLNGIIKKLDKELETKTAELDNANREMDEYLEVYRMRLRNIYEEGEISYLEVLLGAEDFTGFLMRLDIVSQLIEHDNKLIESMEAKCAEITKVAQEIEEKKKKNLEAKSKIASQELTLEKKANDAQTVIKKLSATEKKYLKELSDAEESLNALNDRLDDLISKDKDYVGGAFLWPVPGKSYISSSYGYRKDPFTGKKKFHAGIDIPAPVGYKIIASNSGTVASVGWDYAGGNYLVIDHGGEMSTRYFHCNKILVKKGQEVSRGKHIAEIGRTGRVTGPHLHFEFRIKREKVNPLSYISR